MSPTEKAQAQAAMKQHLRKKSRTVRNAMLALIAAALLVPAIRIPASELAHESAQWLAPYVWNQLPARCSLGDSLSLVRYVLIPATLLSVAFLLATMVGYLARWQVRIERVKVAPQQQSGGASPWTRSVAWVLSFALLAQGAHAASQRGARAFDWRQSLESNGYVVAEWIRVSGDRMTAPATEDIRPSGPKPASENATEQPAEAEQSKATPEQASPSETGEGGEYELGFEPMMPDGPADFAEDELPEVLSPIKEVFQELNQDQRFKRATDNMAAAGRRLDDEQQRWVEEQLRDLTPEKIAQLSPEQQQQHFDKALRLHDEAGQERAEAKALRDAAEKSQAQADAAREQAEAAEALSKEKAKLIKAAEEEADRQRLAKEKQEADKKAEEKRAEEKKKQDQANQQREDAEDKEKSAEKKAMLAAAILTALTVSPALGAAALLMLLTGKDFGSGGGSKGEQGEGEGPGKDKNQANGPEGKGKPAPGKQTEGEQSRDGTQATDNQNTTSGGQGSAQGTAKSCAKSTNQSKTATTNSSTSQADKKRGGTAARAKKVGAGTSLGPQVAINGAQPGSDISWHQQGKDVVAIKHEGAEQWVVARLPSKSASDLKVLRVQKEQTYAVVVDNSGQVLLANPSGSSVTGLTEKEANDTKDLFSSRLLDTLAANDGAGVVHIRAAAPRLAILTAPHHQTGSARLIWLLDQATKTTPRARSVGGDLATLLHQTQKAGTRLSGDVATGLEHVADACAWTSSRENEIVEALPLLDLRQGKLRALVTTRSGKGKAVLYGIKRLVGTGSLFEVAQLSELGFRAAFEPELDDEGLKVLRNDVAPALFDATIGADKHPRGSWKLVAMNVTDPTAQSFVWKQGDRYRYQPPSSGTARSFEASKAELKLHYGELRKGRPHLYRDLGPDVFGKNERAWLDTWTGLTDASLPVWPRGEKPSLLFD